MTINFNASDHVLDWMPYIESLDFRNVHLSHIINPKAHTHIWVPGMSAEGVMKIAFMRVSTITTLCGYQYIPEALTQEIKPACPVCPDIAAILINQKWKVDEDD